MGKTEIHIRTHYKMYYDFHKIAICGNIEELGLWVPEEGVVGVEYPKGSGWWCVTFKMEEERDPRQPVQFKFVHILVDDGDEVRRVVRWQEGDNRVLPLYENVFCAWSDQPYPDNILDIELGPDGDPCILTTTEPGKKFSKAPLFTLLGATVVESDEDMEFTDRCSPRPPESGWAGPSPPTSQSYIIGYSQQQRKEQTAPFEQKEPSFIPSPPLSPFHAPYRSPIHTPISSPVRSPMLDAASRGGSMTDSYSFDPTGERDGEASRGPTPMKSVSRGTYTVEAESVDSVSRGDSPASFQSNVVVHEGEGASSCYSFTAPAPLFRGAMEYTSSGDILPIDPTEEDYWDDLPGTRPNHGTDETLEKKAAKYIRQTLTAAQLYEAAAASLRGEKPEKLAMPPAPPSKQRESSVSRVSRQSEQGTDPTMNWASEASISSEGLDSREQSPLIEGGTAFRDSVARGASPGSFQSHIFVEEGQSSTYSIVAPAPFYHEAMEYTSSGDIRPIDPTEAEYWDEPPGMRPLPWEAVPPSEAMESRLSRVSPQGDMENYSPGGERYKPSLTTAEPYMAEGVEKAERERQAEIDKQAEINWTVPPGDQGGARVSRVSRLSEQGDLDSRAYVGDPTEPCRPSFTTAEPYMVDGMTPREGAVPPSESGGVRQSRVSRVSHQGDGEGELQEEGYDDEAVPPIEPGSVRQSRVSRTSRQSQQLGGSDTDPGGRPRVEGEVDGGMPLCRKCDRCEKCEGQPDTCEDCMIDNACTSVHSDMDEFGMGGQPHDYVIYSQQGRPSSGSRPLSGSRTRSVTLTGSGVRPSSGSAINTGARQSSVRPLSGVRYSRPASAEGRRDTSGMPSVEVPTFEIPDGDKEYMNTTLQGISSQTDRVWISDGDVPDSDLPDNCYYDENVDLRAASSQTEGGKPAPVPTLVRAMYSTSDHMPPSLAVDQLVLPPDDSLAHKSSQTVQDSSVKVDNDAQTQRAKRQSNKSMGTQRPSVPASMMTSRQTSMAPSGSRQSSVVPMPSVASRQTSVTPVKGAHRQSSVRSTKGMSRESTASGVKGGTNRLTSVGEKSIRVSTTAPLTKEPPPQQHTDTDSQCCSVM
ncbi:hypothetical protein LSAT2_019785 [Lamellibrachia satsuma]|nr:hypothetical protein LSAT2_019785 [Lamellibrachia satsuma]